MISDLIISFKMNNGNSNHGKNSLLIFILRMEIYCQSRLQKPSLLTNYIFLFLTGDIFLENFT